MYPLLSSLVYPLLLADLSPPLLFTDVSPPLLTGLTSLPFLLRSCHLLLIFFSVPVTYFYFLLSSCHLLLIFFSVPVTYFYFLLSSCHLLLLPSQFLSPTSQFLLNPCHLLPVTYFYATGGGEGCRVCPSTSMPIASTTSWVFSAYGRSLATASQVDFWGCRKGQDLTGNNSDIWGVG
jgi:hypothetical protein